MTDYLTSNAQGLRFQNHISSFVSLWTDIYKADVSRGCDPVSFAFQILSPTRRNSSLSGILVTCHPPFPGEDATEKNPVLMTLSWEIHVSVGTQTSTRPKWCCHRDCGQGGLTAVHTQVKSQQHNTLALVVTSVE